ncbi:MULTISPECIES: hypothetical protein [Clostridium]|uniref:Uncharacterized protein n=1 Tax=Clostridium carnis TaxID=1530 RepID=A0ABY6SRV0_9CLOT|nr:hypothetical protein [Clostridium carnis]VDG71133.1 Uncharacterised protein [Clostridium carnis]
MSDKFPKPTIKTILNDKKHNSSFVVLAYRKLSKNELIFSYNLYLSQNHLKRLPSNTTVEYQTLFGYNLE